MAAQPLVAHPAERRWLALTWLIFLVTAASFLTSIVLWARNGFAVPPISFYSSSWMVVMQWLVIVVPGTVGLLLGLRLGGNSVPLTLSGVGLIVAIENVADMLVATPGFTATSIGPTVAWVASTFTFAAVITLVILLVLTFPTGRLVGPSWGFAAWLSVIGSVLLVLYQGFAPGNLTWYRDLPNPMAVSAGTETWLRIGWYLGIVSIAGALVAAAASVVVRYRTSDQVGRQQLKWFVYGIAILVVTAIFEMVSFVTLPRDSALGTLLLAALFVGGSLPPIAALIAITRYGLYEIDVLINRTFVFGALTAVLAGLYAAGIRFFQVLFVAITGQESDGALVLTTLVLATTFTPIKSRLEAIAARRYRPPAAEAAGPHIPPGTLLTEDVLRTFVTDVVREELARRDRE